MQLWLLRWRPWRCAKTHCLLLGWRRGRDNNYGRDRWSVSNRAEKKRSNVNDVNINDGDEKKKKKK